VLELIAGAHEAGQVGVPEVEARERQVREPPEGDGAGMREGHELLTKLGAPDGCQVRVGCRRNYLELEAFGVATGHGVLDGAADGAQVRSRQVEAEAEGLDGTLTVAVALALRRRTR
jgi:hypothetical protein